jgi:hypothetical protein
MKKLAVYEDKIKRAIRDIVVIDPLISIAKLQDALFDKGYKTSSGTVLDWRYIHKLHHKVHRNTVEQTDREQVVERIAQMKERYRLMFERLLRIVYYSDDLKKEGFSPPSIREQINAINSIVRLDALIFNSELDAGIFERHLGTLEIEQRNKPLPPELKAVMLKAFVNWGIVPEDALTHEPTTITIKPTQDGVVEQKR